MKEIHFLYTSYPFFANHNISVKKIENGDGFNVYGCREGKIGVKPGKFCKNYI